MSWCEYMMGAYIGAQGPRSVSAFARWIESQNEQNDEYNARVVRVPPVWLFDSVTRLPKVSLSLPESALREVASVIEGASFVVYDMKVLGLETAKTLKGPTRGGREQWETSAEWTRSSISQSVGNACSSTCPAFGHIANQRAARSLDRVARREFRSERSDVCRHRRTGDRRVRARTIARHSPSEFGVRHSHD